MRPLDPDVRAMEDPERQLEKAFIDEFLRARGLDREALRALGEAETRQVLIEASIYAAARLAEVEARAHYVHEIHSRE